MIAIEAAPAQRDAHHRESDAAMPRLERAIRKACETVLWVSMGVTFAILVANTLLRYATGTSLQWANELPELLFPWTVMAGVVLAAAHGAHITTSFLVEALPEAWRRVVLVSGWLAVAGLHFTLAWSTYRILPLAHEERSPILHVPGSVTYGCVMAGLLLLALFALLAARRAWRPAPAPS